MRTYHELSNEELRKIFYESGRRCYCDIADEFNITYTTVKRVVRNNKNRLKRYKNL